MKRNNNDFETKYKAIASKRLNEIMNAKGMSRTTIRKILEGEYDYPVLRQTFDKYQKSINSMPREFTDKVSEILGVDPGYLAGNDNFVCGSYGEYLDHNNLLSDPDFIKYDRVLTAAGLILMSSIDDKDQSIEYSIYDRNESASQSRRFTAEGMKRLYKKIQTTILDVYHKYPDDMKGGDADGSE